MTVQFVEIAGQKMAMLPVGEYERLLETAEERAEIFAAERAQKRREDGEEYLPSELVDSILNGENPLRVWRRYRGISLNELANLIGITPASLSRIESGKQNTGASNWRAIADALGVLVDDILPVD